MSPIGVGGWAPEARYWVCGFEACDGFETISRGSGDCAEKVPREFM